MICPKCKVKVHLKKYQVYDCRCGSRLMLIEINKKQTIEKLN